MQDKREKGLWWGRPPCRTPLWVSLTVTPVAEIALVTRNIVYDIAGASVLVTIFQKIWHGRGEASTAVPAPNACND